MAAWDNHAPRTILEPVLPTGRKACSAQGIHINAVNPAAIDTEMIDRLADGMNTKKDDLTKFHPIGRLGRVEEVAEAVLWLCSGKASFVTGHSLIIDGGFTAC